MAPKKETKRKALFENKDRALPAEKKSGVHQDCITEEVAEEKSAPAKKGRTTKAAVKEPVAPKRGPKALKLQDPDSNEDSGDEPEVSSSPPQPSKKGRAKKEPAAVTASSKESSIGKKVGAPKRKGTAVNAPPEDEPPQTTTTSVMTVSSRGRNLRKLIEIPVSPPKKAKVAPKKVTAKKKASTKDKEVVASKPKEAKPVNVSTDKVSNHKNNDHGGDNANCDDKDNDDDDDDEEEGGDDDDDFEVKPKKEPTKSAKGRDAKGKAAIITENGSSGDAHVSKGSSKVTAAVPAKRARGAPKKGAAAQAVPVTTENGGEDEIAVVLMKPTKGRRKRKSSESSDGVPPPAMAKQSASTVARKIKKIIASTSPVSVQLEKPKANRTTTNFAEIDFKLTENREWTVKISSWNVAGLRALVQKGGLDYVEHEQPDILCLQETKCVEDQLPKEALLKGYHPYWLCQPGGQAGIAVYSKVMPMNVVYGLGDSELDEQGRLLTAEYEKFYLVCAYVPNAGRKLVSLSKRLRWDTILQAYLKELDAKKPVVLCGDLNVSHQEIDLANPKTNKKSAGFTQEERDGMSEMLKLGFVDTFRHLYPNLEKAYTYWTYLANARTKNVGWRLDYFIVSERIAAKVVDNVIRSTVLGSDHCPITLFLNI